MDAGTYEDQTELVAEVCKVPNSTLMLELGLRPPSCTGEVQVHHKGIMTLTNHRH